MTQWLEELGIGIAAGLLSGLTGVGGGIIMVPLLVSLIHLDQHVAQGTSLLTFSMPVLAMAARRYWLAGKVKPIASIGIAIGMLPMSMITAVWAQSLPTALLRQIFGGFIAVVGLYQIWQTWRGSVPEEKIPRSPLWAWGLLGGIIAGTLSGLTGIGGGVVLVPYLVWVVRLDQHTAQGTSLLTLSFPILLAAAIPYLKAERALPLASLGLGVGLVLGSSLSAQWAQNIRSSYLSISFGVLLVIIGIYFVLKA
ncbi:MAG: sulfite exporter TauE/SafE family protein [Bacteroidia bacterium]|nr:sulfite exporter TauE/SafE family protein [Bacteroidia bacterium]MDW8057652.1 sulfite exporter TauE/SafE family protein [Bacteroidia bacterium]